MQEGSTQSLIGRELDKRYRILSPLGEGGMGTVFLGEHIRIGRQVAIKVLNPQLADSDDFLERFEREAIAAGRLDHPNCVPVTDSGHLEDGTAYLIMELVSGRSLGSLLDDESQIPPIRALRIIRHTLRGLGHAHDVGIVHRDIKPDNIMLSQREHDDEFARVLDFGIAKLRDDESRDNAALTQAGMAVGTPAYLSPEQALGDTIDVRSDLYSCTAVLFNMLCGRPPFQAESPIGVLTKHASEDAPHLWDFAPYLEDYPGLDALVQKGLAKDRNRRFQDAGEYVRAIDECLLQLGAQLTPVPEVYLPGAMQTGPATAADPGVPPQTHPRDPTSAGPLGIAHAYRSPRAQIEPTLIGQELIGQEPRQRHRNLKRFLAASVLLMGIVTAVVLSTRAGKNTVAPGGGSSILLQTYEAQLREGESCQIRLEAVKKLQALGDKRAIPSLKKARRRMRGGVLGIGKKNSNKCLSKAARNAIADLEK